MKRIVFLIVSIMLVFVMALSFSACKNKTTAENTTDDSTDNSFESSAEKSEEKAEENSNEKSQEKSVEKASIFGTWKANIDVTAAVNDAIDTVNAGMKDYMDIGKISLDCTLVLNEDGSYKASVDKDSFNNQIKKVEEGLLSAHRKYIDNIIKIHGLDTTVEDYLLENDDMTLEEETAIFIEKCDFAKLMVDTSGYYKFEDGKLSFASAPDKFDNSFYTVNLEEKALIFKACSKQKYGVVNISKLLPVKFEK